MMAPNSVRQIATVAKYELLKYLRGRRLLAIVLLTIIISAIFLIVPPAIGTAYPKDPTDFITRVLSFLSVLSILSATFFGADAIVSEYESKTGYFLFPNPIRKTAIFLGKFIASVLVSVGAIGLYYVIRRQHSAEYRSFICLLPRLPIRHTCDRLSVQRNNAQFGILPRADVLHLLPHLANCRRRWLDREAQALVLDYLCQ